MRHRFSSSASTWVRALGFAGLLPFMAGAAASWALSDPSERARAGFALIAYAATIAAFLGGLNWGHALRMGGLDPMPLMWGVVPQLVGWLALLLPLRVGLLVCSATLVACYIVDRRLYQHAGLGAWLGLRLQLTVVAATSCIVSAGA